MLSLYFLYWGNLQTRSHVMLHGAGYLASCDLERIHSVSSWDTTYICPSCLVLNENAQMKVIC